MLTIQKCSVNANKYDICVLFFSLFVVLEMSPKPEKLIYTLNKCSKPTVICLPTESRPIDSIKSKNFICHIIVSVDTV